MKQIALIITLAFSLNLNAKAFYSNASIQVTPLVAKAIVVNYWERPIVCSGQVFGRTTYGNVFNSWMNYVVIWPGSHAFVSVYTNYYDRFVNAWSDINCRWY